MSTKYFLMDNENLIDIVVRKIYLIHAQSTNLGTFSGIYIKSILFRKWSLIKIVWKDLEWKQIISFTKCFRKVYFVKVIFRQVDKYEHVQPGYKVLKVSFNKTAFTWDGGSK